MPSTIPISMTNVVTTLGIESAFGVVATNGKIIAYEQNTLVRNQTLEKNTELRGVREMGTRVPGAKSPSGTLLGHQTDLLLPLSLYAALGGYDGGTVKPIAAPTASLVASAGLVDVGDHYYKIVVTTPDGLKVSASSLVVSVADDTTHGKVLITNALGAMPAGWTWAIYRTKVGAPTVWLGPVTGASTLAASVTTFTDNEADSALSGAFPAATADDYTHVFTPGLTLPSLSIERKLPYVSDAAAFFVALGSVVNKSTLTVKGTGYFDIGLDYLFASLSGPTGTSFDIAAKDWRGGEKLHHAMALAAKVKLDSSAFAKFQDIKIDHMNNLDTSDYPVGGAGDRGSLVPMQAETQITGTLKVCEPGDIGMVHDYPATHELSIEWDFATPGHSVTIDVKGIQFDPTDPSPSGQGILKFSANGFASQPTGDHQIVCTVVNDQLPAVYNT
jgi:hypothetical protein